MNAKEFMDDRKLPFHRTYGVLALGSGYRDSGNLLKIHGRNVGEVAVITRDDYQGKGLATECFDVWGGSLAKKNCSAFRDHDHR